MNEFLIVLRYSIFLPVFQLDVNLLYLGGINYLMVRRGRHRKGAVPGASGAGGGFRSKQTKAMIKELIEINRLVGKKGSKGERPHVIEPWTPATERKKQPPTKPKLKDYSAIPLEFNRPIRLTSGNYVIRTTVDLLVIKPLEPLPKAGWGGVKIKRSPQEPEKRQNAEIVVEYNPLGWPSKSKKKKGNKIHVQTEGRTKQKVGFAGDDLWKFVRFAQA
ncbi:MAG: hypothetical protein ABIE23_04315, partial [archaeon]